MTVDVPGRGNDVDSGPQLRLSVQQVVRAAGIVDEVLHGVVAALGGGELVPLAHDGGARQPRVPAAMIEVKMAVDDDVDVREPHPGGAECVGQLDPLWSVPVLGLSVAGAESGVEQQHPSGVSDDVAVDSFDPRLTRSGLLGRPDERAEQDPPYVTDAHHAVQRARRRWPSREAAGRTAVSMCGAVSAAVERPVTQATRAESQTSPMTRAIAMSSSVSSRAALGVHGVGEHRGHQHADGVDLAATDASANMNARVSASVSCGSPCMPRVVCLSTLMTRSAAVSPGIGRLAQRGLGAARTRGRARRPAGGSWRGSSGRACRARRRPARRRPASGRRRSRPRSPAAMVASRIRLRRSRWAADPRSSTASELALLTGSDVDFPGR